MIDAVNTTLKVDEVIKENWNDFFKELNSLYLQNTLTELKQKIEAL